MASLQVFAGGSGASANNAGEHNAGEPTETHQLQLTTPQSTAPTTAADADRKSRDFVGGGGDVTGSASESLFHCCQFA